MHKVDFYEGETWDKSRRIVVWQGQIVGVGSTLTCHISSEVIRDRFQATSSDEQTLLEAFRLNRPQLERIVERLVDSQRFEPDGTIAIRNSDI